MGSFARLSFIVYYCCIKRLHSRAWTVPKRNLVILIKSIKKSMHLLQILVQYLFSCSILVLVLHVAFCFASLLYNTSSSAVQVLVVYHDRQYDLGCLSYK